MNVSLLAYTPNPISVIYTAARTCYSKLSPIEIWDSTKDRTETSMFNLIEEVTASGHYSILEHVNFTFAIKGVSRVLTHQLVRHRFISPSQQSQRYVKMTPDLFRYYIPETVSESELAKERYKQFVLAGLEEYQALEELGATDEDARYILPGASYTNVVITLNLRELIHLCNLRLCKRAQKEIRLLVSEMSGKVAKLIPALSKYLVSACRALSYCPEGKKSCGLYPTIQDLLSAYNARCTSEEDPGRTKQRTKESSIERQ